MLALVILQMAAAAAALRQLSCGAHITMRHAMHAKSARVCEQLVPKVREGAARMLADDPAQTDTAAGLRQSSAEVDSAAAENCLADTDGTNAAERESSPSSVDTALETLENRIEHASRLSAEAAKPAEVEMAAQELVESSAMVNETTAEKVEEGEEREPGEPGEPGGADEPGEPGEPGDGDDASPTEREPSTSALDAALDALESGMRAGVDGDQATASGWGSGDVAASAAATGGVASGSSDSSTLKSKSFREAEGLLLEARSFVEGARAQFEKLQGNVRDEHV